MSAVCRVVGLSVLLSALLVPTGSSAQSRDARPASLDELVKRGVAAIRANDAGAYVALLFREADARTQCPDTKVPAELFEETRKKTRKAVGKCHALIDWSKAKQVRVEGGEKKDRDQTCPGVVWPLKDVKVIYRVGATSYRVKLDDPVIMGDRYVFSDDPRCRECSTPDCR